MKKHRKCMSKIVTLILTFISIVNILPMEVLANSVSDAVAQNVLEEAVVNNLSSERNSEDAEILFEVKEKRDAHTKVYKKSDGSYTAIITEDSLHYLDGGEWEEINNSMILDDDLYTNVKNLFNVEFPENIDSNESLTVENDGYELSFVVDDIAESTGVIENNAVESYTDISVADEAISLTQSSIIYNEVAEDTDLQYIVTPNSIKENIIVSDKDSVKDTYTFTFERNGLDAEKLDDGSVVFKNELNEIKFRIPRPIMNDSNFAFSYDIDVALTENEDNTITLEYSPSKEWTSSWERVYPVTIDPAIRIDCGKTFVEYMSVGKDSAETGVAYKELSDSSLFLLCNGFETENSDGILTTIENGICVKIDTEYFSPLGKDILFTEVHYLINGMTESGGKIFAREITSDWTYTPGTYSTKHTLSENVLDYYTSPISEGEEYDTIPYIHFNITDAFNGWFNGGKANNGFEITINEGKIAFVKFNDNSSTGTLVLDYIDLGGYDENLNYHTQEAGRAGTGYVNDFTQTLTVIRDDIKISDTTGTIGMIYNSAGYKKLNSLGYNHMLAYGNNWLPNYLKAIWVDEENGGNVTYYTGTGASIDFVCLSKDTDEKEFKELYSETYGDHGYQLEYKSNEYIITRPDGYVEKFNKDGLLVSVTAPGKDGETISIEYDKGHINTITDSDGKSYTYNYDEDSNLLLNITYNVVNNGDITENIIRYDYDENNNLETVTFPDGKSVLYEYNNNDMTSMENIDNYRIKYEYENNRVEKVTEQAKNGDIYEIGNSITYEKLNAYQIKLTDATGAYEIYHFGNWGNLLYTIDSNGKYVLHGDVDSNDITHYASTSAYREFSENLLSNSSFEDGLTDWTPSGTISVQPNNGDVPVRALFGSIVLKISGTDSINQTITPVSTGKYIFSAYVFSETQNGLNDSLDLIISYNGMEEAPEPTTVTTTNGNWDRYMVELVISEDVNASDGVNITVEFKTNGGTFYIDGAQLECAASVSSYNYIQNGSFNDGLNHWDGSTGLSSKISSINDKTVNALKLPTNEAVTISQEVAIDGKIGEIISVGGWFKGRLPNTSTNNSILKDLIKQTEATSTNEDSTTPEDSTASENTENTYDAYIEVICSANQKIKIPFNESIDDWQFAGREFSLQGSSSTLTINIHYSENINTALLSNIEITKTKVGLNIYTCPCANCKVINCPCVCSSSSYCYCKQCMREDENSKRDSFGNLMLGNKYDEIITAQQLTQRVADNVTANFNLSNGLLKNVYDAAKAYTTYSYNASGDITEISANGSSVKITYDNDRIKTINQNGTTYNFAYDGWGQLTKVSIGDNTIVSYEYDSGKYRDRIIEVNYHYDETKKDTITFDYEMYSYNGEITIFVNNVEKFTCQYNPNGTLKEVSLENGREIYYNNGETKVWVPENDPTTQADTELLYSYDIVARKRNSQEPYSTISETIGNANFITNKFGVSVKNNQFLENMKVTSENGKSISFSVIRDAIGRYGGDPSAFTNAPGSDDSNLLDFRSDVNDENSDSLAWINGSDTPVIVKTNYNYYDSDGSFGSSVASGESTDSNGDETESGSTGEEASTESEELKTITSSIILQKNNGDSSTDSLSYKYTYRYDKNNNIAFESISDTDPESQNTYFECHYVYNNNNQLIRVNQTAKSPTEIPGALNSIPIVNPENSATYIYEYDKAGNLDSKIKYNYTTDKDLQNHTSVGSIQYSGDVWKDKEIKIDETYFDKDNNENIKINTAITYDNVGNPTAIGGKTLTWNGKLLETYVDGDKTYKYEYDVNGLCCRKTVSVTNTETIIETYNYIWSDGRLTGQVYETGSYIYSIKYIYDIFNSPYGFIINCLNISDNSVEERAYLYLKNLKGDIIGIVNESGAVVLTYEYDPWGAISNPYTSNDDFANVISKLPITYRGYCYDYDTGFYYIQGRWYNPEMGRFINADNLSNLGSTGTALSYNLYAYCENNPVMYAINNKDPEFANTINSNYLYNKRISKSVTGYIDKQKDGIATKLRYGITTLEPLGCTCIATYNALIMLGNRLAPCDIIRDFEMNNLYYYGVFGTNGNNPARFFSKLGYDVTITYLENYDLHNTDELNEIHDIVKNNDANILFYKDNDVGHFIAIRYAGTNNEDKDVYTGFNLDVDDNNVDSIIKLIPGESYENGYVLISVSNNKVNENNSAD